MEIMSEEYHSCQVNESNFKPTKQSMDLTTMEKLFHKPAIQIVGLLFIFNSLS